MELRSTWFGSASKPKLQRRFVQSCRWTSQFDGRESRYSLHKSLHHNSQYTLNILFLILDTAIGGVLILLNNELRPTKVTKKFKPSILAAQEDIILFAETDEEVASKIKELETTYTSYGFRPIPRLVFRGKNLQALRGIYEVRYRDTVYQLDSAVQAIDTLVKFTTVFGLEYSKICRLVWNFICSFIYDIPVAEQYEAINKLKRLLAPCAPAW